MQPVFQQFRRNRTEQSVNGGNTKPGPESESWLLVSDTGVEKHWRVLEVCFQIGLETWTRSTGGCAPSYFWAQFYLSA